MRIINSLTQHSKEFPGNDRTVKTKTSFAQEKVTLIKDSVSHKYH